MSTSRTNPAPWALLALAGCMFGPYNGQTVPTPSSSTHVVLLDWLDGDDLSFEHYGAPAAELGAL